MQTNLVDAVRDAGVVGAGGAGFPTHVKLNAKADTVVVNGAECEPLLRVDQQLMACKPEILLKALQMVVDAVGAGRGVIALKEKYHTAQKAFESLLPRYPALSLYPLGNFYPAGDEQVTVYEVTGRIVPEGGIPLNVGVVVTNVETLLNIYEAATAQKPVTETYVTVTGAVHTPRTMKLPVGITVGQALELAGGPTCAEYSVVNGGPMMGALASPEDPITKTTKGLIVLPAGHPLPAALEKDLKRTLREAGTACMQCSLCTEVCPRSLLGHRLQPHILMRLAGYGSVCDDASTPMNAYLCCGCRLCEYACVMDLQPWKLNNSLKKTLGEKGLRNNLHAQPEKTAAFREYKQYPVGKLIKQLGLAPYDLPAPLNEAVPAFNRVAIPLRQHVGAPAEPVVQVGDKVRKGDLIAEIPKDKLGANVHASIDGAVRAVGPGAIAIEAAK